MGNKINDQKAITQGPSSVFMTACNDKVYIYLTTEKNKTRLILQLSIDLEKQDYTAVPIEVVQEDDKEGDDLCKMLCIGIGDNGLPIIMTDKNYFDLLQFSQVGDKI